MANTNTDYQSDYQYITNDITSTCVYLDIHSHTAVWYYKILNTPYNIEIQLIKQLCAKPILS